MLTKLFDDYNISALKKSFRKEGNAKLSTKSGDKKGLTDEAEIGFLPSFYRYFTKNIFSIFFQTISKFALSKVAIRRVENTS